MLPSRYAPGGLSEVDQRRTLTVGRQQRTSSNYVIRVIEDRIDDHVRHAHHKGAYEMVPTDDYKEVSVISDYVTDTRQNGRLTYDDSRMEIEGAPSLEQPLGPVLGNMSYLVVDTNFMLSHLDIVDGLRSISGKYGLVIVIPMVVVQELDGLKNSNRYTDVPSKRASVNDKNGERSVSHPPSDNSYSSDWPEDSLSSASVGHLARWANDWIYTALAERSPLVRGQRPNQRLDKTAVKDDAILDCCMYFQAVYPGTLQILLSNDKNLCLKALTNDVLTVSYRKGMSAKIIAETIHNENVSRFGILEADPAAVPAAVPVPHPQASPSPVPLAITARQIFLEVQKITLSVIHRCMELVYGDDVHLLRNYSKETVVTLRQCSEVMIRFWKPVFAEIFGKGFRPFDNVDGMQPLFCDEPASPYELQQFVEFWSQVLTVLYEAEMDHRQNEALVFLIRRWSAASGS